jgi:drug/metabolite transporter (DMT)-like permease
MLQIIFTTIPLWSALIAIVFLHEAGLGALGWSGAAIIVVAGVYDAKLFGK